MRKTKRFLTSFLFADSSFIQGVGSVLDISGSCLYFNTSATPEEADLKALESDWGNVAQDLTSASEQFIILYDSRIKKDSKELTE